MDTQQFYTTISRLYNDETYGGTVTVRSLGRHQRTEAVLRILHKYVKQSSLVADIGCGPAQFTAKLIGSGHRYLGIDLAPKMFVSAAKQENSKPATFLAGRIEEIPLADRSVDVIICIGVIEYVPDFMTAIRELRRILKSSGIVVVSFPNLCNPIHATRAILRPLVAPFLRSIMPDLKEKTVFVSSITHKSFVPRSILKKLAQSGLVLQEAYYHGYSLSPFNRRLSPKGLERSLQVEQIGRKVFPTLGSNCILCLRAE